MLKFLDMDSDKSGVSSPGSDYGVNSATSPTTPRTQNIMQEMRSLPSQIITKTIYHVILDSKYEEFKKGGSGREVATVIGKISKKLGTDRIPVVFDEEDAVHVSKKLIALSVNRGCVGDEGMIQYPYLGAIVMGFKINLKNAKNITTEEEHYSSSMRQADIIHWKNGNVQRGMMHKKLLEDIEIVSAKYIVRKNITPENAFALMAASGRISCKAITELKCIYEGKRLQCFDDMTKEQRRKFEKTLEKDLEERKTVHIGNITEENTREEKALYLLNKSRQAGGINSWNTDIVTADNNTDNNNNTLDLEALYRDKYHKWKNIYTNSNSQAGGNLNVNNEETEMDHSSEDEAYWKPRAEKMKSQYLAKKSSLKNQSGGNLNVNNEGTEMDHPTEDETYWKPRAKKMKSQYLAKKNSLKNQAGGNLNVNNEGTEMDYPTEDEAYWGEKANKMKDQYHLELKNKTDDQSGDQVDNQAGGNLNVNNEGTEMDHPTDDEAYWKPRAEKMKSQYLAKKNSLKSQSGGNLNVNNEGTEMDHPTEDEAYWKPRAEKMKSQYLAKKSSSKSQAGGKLNINNKEGSDVSLDHPTEDEAYWKPRAIKMKAQYLSKKSL
jgi:hypothetical protein